MTDATNVTDPTMSTPADTPTPTAAVTNDAPVTTPVETPATPDVAMGGADAPMTEMPKTEEPGGTVPPATA